MQQQLLDFFRDTGHEISIDAPVTKINHITFNQDRSRFLCCHSNGAVVYQIFDDFSFVQCAKIDLQNIRCGIVYRDTDFLLIGTSDQTISLWLDAEATIVGEISFSQKIISVDMSDNCIVVACLNKIFVYDYPSLERLQMIPTSINTNGIAIAAYQSGNILTLGPRQGSFQVITPSDASKKKTLFPFTNTNIFRMELSYDGTHLAITDDVGKEIKIYETISFTEIKILTRGKSTAQIRSMTFSKDNKYLAVSSDSRTVHIFKIMETGQKSLFWSTLSYQHEYTFVQVTTEINSVLVFGDDSSRLIAIGNDGKIRFFTINEDQGTVQIELESPYLADFM